MASNGEGNAMAEAGREGGGPVRRVLVTPQEERFLGLWQDFWWSTGKQVHGQGTLYRLAAHSLSAAEMERWHERQRMAGEEIPRYAPIFRESAASRISRALPGMILGELVGDAVGISAADGAPFGQSSSFAQLTLFSLEALIATRLWADVNGKWADQENLRAAEFFAVLMWGHAQGTAWSEIMSGDRAARFPHPLGWLAARPEMRFRAHPDEAALGAVRDFATRNRASAVAGNDSRSAGVLASSVPLAMWSDAPDRLVALATKNAALTHGAPQAHVSAAALAVVCNALLNEHDLRTAVREAIEAVGALDGAADTVHALETALTAAEVSTVEEFARTFDGVWDADAVLGVAVHAAMVHGRDFDRAVTESAGVQGDRPATAGVCGALVGIASGVAAIPAARLSPLAVGGVAQELIDDALAEFASANPPRSQEWHDRYDHLRGL